MSSTIRPATSGDLAEIKKLTVEAGLLASDEVVMLDGVFAATATGISTGTAGSLTVRRAHHSTARPSTPPNRSRIGYGICTSSPWRRAHRGAVAGQLSSPTWSGHSRISARSMRARSSSRHRASSRSPLRAASTGPAALRKRPGYVSSTVPMTTRSSSGRRSPPPGERTCRERGHGSPRRRTSL